MYNYNASPEEALEKIKILANEMKPRVEMALEMKYDIFEVVKFVPELLSGGAIYKIKIKVGEGKYIHIKVSVTFPQKIFTKRLLAQEPDKTLNDPL